MKRRKGKHTIADHEDSIKQENWGGGQDPQYKNAKISVIIPVYNAEQTIERCIRSVLRQSFRNFEIIVVNDGSEDTTEAKIQKYIEADERIKYIRIRNNVGASEARNTGLQAASGKYITFADADDLLHPLFLERMLQAAETYNFPLVSCKEKRVDVKDNFQTWDAADAFQPSVSCHVFDSTFDYCQSYARRQCWGSLYRRDVAEKLRFNRKLCVGEDLVFYNQALIISGGVLYLDEELYGYSNNEYGISRGKLDNTIITEIYAWKLLLKHTRQYLGQEFRGTIASSILYVYLTVCRDLYFRDTDCRFKEKLLRESRDNIVKLKGDRNIRLKARISLVIFAYAPEVYGVYLYVRKRILGGREEIRRFLTTRKTV